VDRRATFRGAARAAPSSTTAARQRVVSHHSERPCGRAIRSTLVRRHGPGGPAPTGLRPTTSWPAAHPRNAHPPEPPLHNRKTRRPHGCNARCLLITSQYVIVSVDKEEGRSR
jgi:hypothetical protein